MEKKNLNSPENRNNLMEYKGYQGKIEYDDETEHFYGEVINLRDVITFQGESVAELRQAMQDSIDDYLEFCVQRGEDPEKPFSGKYLIRINPDLHRKLYLEARRRGISLNQMTVDTLENVAKNNFSRL